MPNTFYAPGEHRAERVEDLFATIANRYDLINDLQSFGLHRLWKRKLIKLASLLPAQRALDICCGTGDVAFRLAKSGADVFGIDFSSPMLAVAASRNHCDVHFLRGDGLNLPFTDNTFDVVTISYGLRNLANVTAGLSEIRRVLRPGGRALVLDFGKPDNSFVRSGYYAYLRYFVPVFGRIFCGNSATHAYIYESLLAYPAQRGIAQIMQDSGWKNVQIVNLAGGTMSINLACKPAPAHP